MLRCSIEQSKELNKDFQNYIQQPLESWDIAEGALLIARQEYPKLDTKKYLSVIKEMARDAAGRMAAGTAKLEKLGRLNQYFFGEMGFKGDQENYFDPQNSYLPDVLDRRLGIPITLSVLYLKLAWEAGCPLFGINFPGHFLVAWKESESEIDPNLYIDVFNTGKVLDRGGLEGLLEKSGRVGEKVRMFPHLRNAGVRDILHRMLGNLKAIHISKDQVERALWVVEWMVLLKPQDLDSLRDKGVFCYALGRLEEAEKSLTQYLERPVKPQDYSQVWQILQAVQAQNPIRLN